jgi:hypothetical protein
MRRIITIAFLCLASLGGVASADRGHHHRTPTVREHRGGGVSVHPTRRHVQPNRRYVQPRNRYTRPHYRSNVRVVHRPIYVRHRPVIRYRYYNYYQRPALVVENPAPLAGYYWVRGSWQWNGAEWIWQPGHYEPDPNWTGEYYTPSSGSVYFYGSF